MEKQFVGFAKAITLEQAKEVCPWARAIIECAGGYNCFESVDHYEVIQFEKERSKDDIYQLFFC
jgi:hypothetical protein